MKVCVLGAGIIGATTAWRLRERFRDTEAVGGADLSVELVADSFSPETTTDASAGFWLPFHWGGTTDDDLE